MRILKNSGTPLGGVKWCKVNIIKLFKKGIIILSLYLI
jgi:hypothetical protein